MDYKQFFDDVYHWIGEANQMAVKSGMESQAFWLWVSESSSQLCQKYGEHPLAVKQMVMMFEWLEEVAKS